MLTERFDEALSYASAVHRTQRRKGAEIPYVSHLLAVCSLAIEAGADEEQAIAALLHDAVEDRSGLARLEDIRQRFGERVAGIVSDCTDSWSDPKPEWRPRKEAYVGSLAGKSPDSLLGSLADKIHNASAINADLATRSRPRASFVTANSIAVGASLPVSPQGLRWCCAWSPFSQSR